MSERYIEALNRVAELERERDELRSELAANAHACGVQMDQARAAEAEVERLRWALEEYADAQYWVAAVGPMGNELSGWCGAGKGWERARAALAGKGEHD